MPKNLMDWASPDKFTLNFVLFCQQEGVADKSRLIFSLFYQQECTTDKFTIRFVRIGQTYVMSQFISTPYLEVIDRLCRECF